MPVQVSSTTDSKENVTASMADISSKPVEETPAAEEVEETQEAETQEASEPSEVEEAEEKTEDKPKKKGGYQKRIDKLTRQKSEMEQEKEYWRGQALRTQTPPPETKPVADTSKRPKTDDYQTHDEYVEALTDWKVDQKILADKQRQQEERVKSESIQRETKHQERVAKFAEDHDDWEEVIEPVSDLKLSMAVYESFVGSDNGPELMYELAKDPKELRRINGLPPIQAAIEIGKISSRLSKPEKQKPAKSAPHPVSPVRTRSGGVSKSPYDDSDMSQTEYEAWWNKRKRNH